MRDSIPLTIEKAFKAVIIEFMPQPPAVWVRISRSQRQDLPQNGNGGAAFPQIFIAATSKYYENVDATWEVDISFNIHTHIDDDPFGEQNAEIETALEAIIDAANADGSEINARFCEIVREQYPRFNFGAFYSDSAPSPPTGSDGVRTLSQTLTLHFAY